MWICSHLSKKPLMKLSFFKKSWQQEWLLPNIISHRNKYNIALTHFPFAKLEISCKKKIFLKGFAFVIFGISIFDFKILVIITRSTVKLCCNNHYLNFSSSGSFIVTIALQQPKFSIPSSPVCFCLIFQFSFVFLFICHWTRYLTII